MGDKIGSLEAGKLADIIIIETKSPNMQPVYNPYATLVWQAYPANIRLTMVGGRVIAKDGKVLTIDMPKHEKEWRRITQKVEDFAKTLNSLPK